MNEQLSPSITKITNDFEYKIFFNQLSDDFDFEFLNLKLNTSIMAGKKEDRMITVFFLLKAFTNKYKTDKPNHSLDDLIGRTSTSLFSFIYSRHNGTSQPSYKKQIIQLSRACYENPIAFELFRKNLPLVQLNAGMFTSFCNIVESHDCKPVL